MSTRRAVPAFLAIVWVVWRKPWFGFVASLPAVVGLGYHVWGSIERTALSEQALIGNLKPDRGDPVAVPRPR